jgi:hypothetical protein
VIGSCDDQDLNVRAQYNPKEIELSKQVSWKDEDAINGRTPKDDFDVVDIEYTGAAVRTKKSYERRPHLCVVAWGDRDSVSFRCVIESLVVKYTVFGDDGRLLRAVCNVKLKETRLRKQLRGR